LERGAEDQWIITTEAGKRFPTEKVILSSGGLSYPAVGTDGAGHQILKVGGPHHETEKERNWDTP
jgi:predicted flavoprotein YhiN